MTSTHVKNPVSKYLFGLSLVFLAYVGFAIVAGQPQSFRLVATLLSFTCACVFTVWTVFGVRLGRTSCVGQTGRVSTYERASEPVTFFVLVTLYLVLGLISAGYLGSLLLRS
jgi:hypothetical protein